MGTNADAPRRINVTNPDEAQSPAIDYDDPRVLWAAERTVLAWVRTGLALMGFGFLVARFGFFLRELAAAHGERISPRQGFSLWIGVGLVLLGVAVNFLSAWQYAWIERQLYPTERRAWPRMALALAVSVILGVLGLAMAGYLVALG
jgi:putative membrane protein